MTGQEHEDLEVRHRGIAEILPLGTPGVILVAHVYAAEGALGQCDCGNPVHDPGRVSLIIDEDSENTGSDVAAASLSAPEALYLANRLARAANLILESQEDNPDLEREEARFSPDHHAGDQQ